MTCPCQAARLVRERHLHLVRYSKPPVITPNFPQIQETVLIQHHTSSSPPSLTCFEASPVISSVGTRQLTINGRICLGGSIGWVTIAGPYNTDWVTSWTLQHDANPLHLPTFQQYFRWQIQIFSLVVRGRTWSRSVFRQLEDVTRYTSSQPHSHQRVRAWVDLVTDASLTVYTKPLL